MRRMALGLLTLSFLMVGVSTGFARGGWRTWAWAWPGAASLASHH